MAPSGPKLLTDGAQCCGQEKDKPTQGHTVHGIYYDTLPRVLYASAPMQAVHEARASYFHDVQWDKLALPVHMQHMAPKP